MGLMMPAQKQITCPSNMHLLLDHAKFRIYEGDRMKVVDIDYYDKPKFFETYMEMEEHISGVVERLNWLPNPKTEGVVIDTTV